MNISKIKYHIDKYISTNPKLCFVKKKNNFIISKGFINYQINVKKLSCPCSNELCEHIIFFLTNIMEISIKKLLFFNKIKKELLNLFANNQDFLVIKEKINLFINEDLDCLICYCSLDDKKFNNDIVECSNCHCYCHKYCFDMCKTKNALYDKICPHCKTGTML
jgi:hypothetical protein